MKKLIVSCTVMLVVMVFVIGSIPITVQAANTSPRHVISSSDTHTMVIDANGILWGWGSNEYGQVGDGTTINRDRPVAIMQDVVYVKAVHGRTFAVNVDGVLFAWGNNDGGLLGDGTSINRHRPVPIHQGILLTGITPQPPTAQPTPPQRQGVGFFATYTHFQYSGWDSRIGIVQSLGVHFPESLHSSFGPQWRDYNLNAQRSMLTGYVVRRDGQGAGGPGSISFFGDGRELLTITTNVHDQPHPVVVDVTGVSVLRIQVSGVASAFTNAVIY